MADKKFTERDFLNGVIASEVAENLKDYAKAQLAKIDAKNENRRKKLTKTQEENEEIKVKILEFLKDKSSVLASTVATELELPNTPKASSLLGQLEKDGKVKSVKPKKSSPNVYSLVE